MYFSLLLQRKDTKRKQTETPFEKGVCGLYQNGGIFAFEAKMHHTNDNLHNDPPINAVRFSGRVCCFYSLPADLFHGRLHVVVIFFSAPTNGLLTEVILWERGSFVGVIHE